MNSQVRELSRKFLLFRHQSTWFCLVCGVHNLNVIVDYNILGTHDPLLG